MKKNNKHIFELGDTVFSSAIAECRRLNLPELPLLIVVNTRTSNNSQYVRVSDVHKTSDNISDWIDSTLFIHSSEVSPCSLL